MAIILITTIGGANSDSYVSVSEFDAFLARKRGAETVAALTSDEKAKGLLEAMLLDYFNWHGRRVTTTQALAHPRYELPKRDQVGYPLGWTEYSSLPTYYSSTEIAQPVKDAQCELAFLILNGQYEQSDALTAPIASFSQDGLSYSYANNGATKAQSGRLPNSVGRLLSGLVQGSKMAGYR